jgi:ATP-dependent DNA helicase RecQ
LMKDQVHNLRKVGVPTIAIFSGMSAKEIDTALDNCVYGDIKLLYLSPERLQTELAIERIRKMNINLIAVDEAHCISQWGYDFRPSYLKIAELRAYLPNVPIMALTATATPRVVEDIQNKLAFKAKNVLQKSFYRSNLGYIVLEEIDKRKKMLEILHKIPGTGIVYVNSRKMTLEVARFLVHHKISADYYHAGLDKEVRSEKQEAWINNKIRIMVATNAFGMGIDHPQVRSVVHLAPPASLEAYFQEAGRGGRDGKDAYAILLFDHHDIPRLEEQWEQSFPEPAFIKKVYLALGSHYQIAVGSELPSVDFEILSFCEHFRLDPVTTYHALKILQELGYLYLNEAVFTPSQIFIKLSREKLYEYLLKHENLADLIRILLRMYQGIQEQAVQISEYKIAKHLKVPKSEIVKKIHYLSTLEILDYNPSSDNPKLSFIGGRLPIDALHIDHQWYQDRKKWKKTMLDGVIHYLTSHSCRSQLLLDYFGEKSGQSCGKCDYCRSQQRLKAKTQIWKDIRQIIIKTLSHKDETIDTLINLVKNQQQPLLKAVLQELTDEEIVLKNGHLYSLNPIHERKG